MVGAAIKGLSKILRKELRKSPVLGKYVKKPRGTPTAAGMVQRRAMLRGAYPAKSPGDKYRKLLGDPGKKLGKATKKPGYKTGLVQGVLATAGTAAILSKSKAKKEAKAKKDEDLKKATEEHKKKTKKKRRKYGKPHA